jgi:hypothetical protein
MEYPYISPFIRKEELIEHFTLTKEERFLLSQWRKEKNILGFAVLLKSFEYLGYPPRKKKDLPGSLILWIAQQLHLNPNEFEKYQWKKRTWDIHIVAVRKFTGFKPFKTDDFNELFCWLVNNTDSHSNRNNLFVAAINRCRQIHLELPIEKELRRLVNSAWQQIFNSVCQKIADRLNPEIYIKMDHCLDFPAQEFGSYEWMKGNPGKLGMKTILREIKRLSFIREFGIKVKIHLKDISNDFQKLLRDRAFPEDAYQIKRHPPNIRYALLTALIHFRQMEVTDNIVKIFLHLIRRIEKKADQSLENALIRDIQKVYGKRLILYKIGKK